MSEELGTFELFVTGNGLVKREQLQACRVAQSALRKWGIENGCACWRQDYTYRADSLNAEFQCGYSVIELDTKGHFDVNKSHAVFVAWE